VGIQPGSAFDHLLEIEVSGPTFTSDGKFHPDVTLFLEARARLRRVDDHASLFEGRWLYRGFTRPYFDLAADDAVLLRTDMHVAAMRLADKIRVDLFAPGESDVVRAPRPGEAVALPKVSERDLLSEVLSLPHCP